MLALKKTLCLILAIAFIVPPCLIYYTIHFYKYGMLALPDGGLAQWIMVVLLIFISIILNFLQYKKIIELKYELFHYLQGSREILLDVDNNVETLVNRDAENEPVV